jgi:hypothetical protein
MKATNRDVELGMCGQRNKLMRNDSKRSASELPRVKEKPRIVVKQLFVAGQDACAANVHVKKQQPGLEICIGGAKSRAEPPRYQHVFLDFIFIPEVDSSMAMGGDVNYSHAHKLSMQRR